MTRNIVRMWVNQPSTAQPDHAYHGQRMLADMDDKEFEHSVRVFPVQGDIVSLQINRSSLSPGWPGVSLAQLGDDGTAPWITDERDIPEASEASLRRALLTADGKSTQLKIKCLDALLERAYVNGYRRGNGD